MDALLKIKKLVNGLLDLQAEGFKDSEGNDKECCKAGDAIKFYDKQNSKAGVRVRKAMNEIKKLAQETRVEIQDIKKAK